MSWRKWRERGAAVIVGVSIVMLGSSIAVAQEPETDDDIAPADEAVVEPDPGDGPVSEFVELPGRCESENAPFRVGLSLDCEFVVRAGVEPETISFPSLSDGSTQHRCAVTAGLVLCRGITGPTRPGEFGLELALNDEVIPDAARILTVGAQADELSLTLSLEETVTFDGLPLEVISYSPVPVNGAFLNLRVRGSRRIVESIPLDAGSPTETGRDLLELDLPAGLYRMWPCVGTTSLTCDELPGGYPLQILDPSIEELIPGHNRRSADRINILFSGSGIGGRRNLIEIASLTLGLGGPVAVDATGQPTDVAGSVTDVHFGPMAIEPLRSNAAKFNFWILPADLGTELSLLFGAGRAEQLDAFGLPNLAVTTFYNDEFSTTSDARSTSYFGRETVPPRSGLAFGGTRLAIDLDAPVRASETLAHEWGHSIFELRDEYYGFDGRPVLHGYPNCAPDLTTASAWWGDVEGQVDPFVDEVLAIRAEMGLNPEPAPNRGDLADLVAASATQGGCYGNFGQATAYRPSMDSLMNTEIPVFGTVNRARVERVLSRFEFGGPLRVTTDVSSLNCEARLDRLFCDGELATLIAPPEDRALTIGGSPCRFDAAAVPVTFTCFALDPGGDDAIVALGAEELATPIERRPPVVVDGPEPAPEGDEVVEVQTTPPESSDSTDTEQPTAPDTSSSELDTDTGRDRGEDPNWQLPMVVGLVVVVASLASVALRRRKSAAVESEFDA